MKLCLECNIHFSEENDSCPNDGSKLIPVGNDKLIGELVGDKYRILCHVGKGSMAVVYKAIQESTGREMAVKMLHQFLGSKEDSVKRFHREARAVSCLHHTNIIHLYDFGMMPDGQPYIVTEFLDGMTLAELLRQRGQLTVKEALPLFEQVLEGIAEAHKNRVIHRDLKPDNIVLQEVDVKLPIDSENLIKHNGVRVVDFGVAKMWGEAGGSSASLTLEGKVCGSPAYMSPEQCKGAEVDARSDIYSLGVVFFEVLTGQRPFAADDLMALMLMHVNKEAPSIGAMMPDVTFPPGLSNVIIKALNKNPEDRHQSAEEFWHEIEAVCRGRRILMDAKDNPAEDWIPFTGSGSSNLSLSTRAGGGEWTLNESAQAGGSSLLNEAYDWSRATTEMSSVKKKRKFSFGMTEIKSAVYITVTILSVIYVGQAYTNWNDARIAISLFESGNYDGCIQILKGLESKKSLSNDLRERMNDSYYRLGSDYANKRDYKKAIDVLENIPGSSRFSKKSSVLIAKCKQRLK